MDLNGARVLRRVLSTALLALTLCGGCSKKDSDAAREFVDRWQQLYNSHDVVSFVSLYSAAGNYSVPGMVWFARTPDELRPILSDMWRLSPDMKTDVKKDFVVADRDHVAFLFDLRFTIKGQAKVIAGATFLHLQDSKIRSQITIARPEATNR